MRLRRKSKKKIAQGIDLGKDGIYSFRKKKLAYKKSALPSSEASMQTRLMKNDL